MRYVDVWYSDDRMIRKLDIVCDEHAVKETTPIVPLVIKRHDSVEEAARDNSDMESGWFVHSTN